MKATSVAALNTSRSCIQTIYFPCWSRAQDCLDQEPIRVGNFR